MQCYLSGRAYRDCEFPYNFRVLRGSGRTCTKPVRKPYDLAITGGKEPKKARVYRTTELKQTNKQTQSCMIPDARVKASQYTITHGGAATPVKSIPTHAISHHICLERTWFLVLLHETTLFLSQSVFALHPQPGATSSAIRLRMRKPLA